MRTIYVSDQTFSGLLYRLVRSLRVSWLSRLAVISFQCSMCFWFSLSSLVSRVAFLSACASWWMAFSIGLSVSYVVSVFPIFCSRGSSAPSIDSRVSRDAGVRTIPASFSHFLLCSIHSDCFRSSRWSIALVAVSPLCCWVIIFLVAASLASFCCWAISLSFLVPCHGLMPSIEAGCVVRLSCGCVGCSVSLSSSSTVCWIVWLRI